MSCYPDQETEVDVGKIGAAPNVIKISRSWLAGDRPCRTRGAKPDSFDLTVDDPRRQNFQNMLIAEVEKGTLIDLKIKGRSTVTAKCRCNSTDTAEQL